MSHPKLGPEDVTLTPLVQESPFPVTPPIHRHVRCGHPQPAPPGRSLPANRLLQEQFPNRFRRDSSASAGKELNHTDIKKLNQSCPASLERRLGESQGLPTPAACRSHQPAARTPSPALCPAPGAGRGLTLSPVVTVGELGCQGAASWGTQSSAHHCIQMPRARPARKEPMPRLEASQHPCKQAPTNADKQVLPTARHRGVRPTGAKPPR